MGSSMDRPILINVTKIICGFGYTIQFKEKGLECDKKT